MVDAPIFTPAACEGTTDLFEVEYFDDKAYLTQSGQLYAEAAAMAEKFRAGGTGVGTSTYVRDPDGNLLEFIVYPDS